MIIGQPSQRLCAALEHARTVRNAFTSAGSDVQNDIDAIDSAIRAAESERIVIAVVGAAKRGKSTLVNGLLGRADDTLAPIGRFPATNVITVFANSPQNQVLVHFEDGSAQCIEQRQIRSFACEEENPGNAKRVASIDVEGAFPSLAPGAVLADMPGSDNALAAQHARTLYVFLPKADAVIFLIAADEPINASELALLRHMKGLGFKGLIVAVNKADHVRTKEMEANELRDGVAHNQRMLAEAGFPDTRIHEISAKDHLEGRRPSGVENLLAEIQDLVQSQRGHLIADRLETRTRNALDTAVNAAESALKLAETSAEELERRREDLERSQRQLQAGRGARESRFVRDWNAAIDEMSTAVRRSSSALENEYREIISQTSGLKLTALLETIHSDVHLALQERLRAPIERCNERLIAAQRELLGSMGVRYIDGPESEAIAQAQTTIGSIQAAVKVGSAAVPGLAAGAALLATPGVIGSLIASAAPSAVAMTWNPLTWIAAGAASTGTAAVTTAQAAAVTMAGTIVAPLSVAAVAYAGYRSYCSWAALRAKERNDLQRAVGEMIRAGADAMLDQISAVQQSASALLADYHVHVEQSMARADEQLISLIRNRPSPSQIRSLTERLVQLRTLADRPQRQLGAAPRTGRLLPPPA